MHSIFSLSYIIVMLLWLGHHTKLVQTERKRESKGVNKSGDLLNDLHNQLTNQLKESVFSPANCLSEVLHYTAVPQTG